MNLFIYNSKVTACLSKRQFPLEFFLVSHVCFDKSKVRLVLDTSRFGGKLGKNFLYPIRN